MFLNLDQISSMSPHLRNEFSLEFSVYFFSLQVCGELDGLMS